MDQEVLKDPGERPQEKTKQQEKRPCYIRIRLVFELSLFKKSPQVKTVGKDNSTHIF